MRKIVWMLIVTCAFAHADDAEIKIDKAWYKPELINGGDSKVCNVLFDDIKKHYVKREEKYLWWAYPIDSNKEKNGVLDVVHLEEVMLPNLDKPISVQKIVVDGKEIIYSQKENHLSSGHAVFHLNAISLDAATKEFNEENIDEFLWRYSYKVFPVDKAYQEPFMALVKFSNSYYVLTMNREGDFFRLFLIKSKDDYKITCEIKTSPDSVDQVKNKLPKFTKLEQSAFEMLGNAGGKHECGTMDAHGWHRNYMRQAFKEALYRPWLSQLRAYPYQNGVEKLQESLDHWSTIGVWNYEIYQEYNSSFEPAKYELKEFYKQQFGLSDLQAEDMAMSVLQNALYVGLGGGFNFNEEYQAAKLILSNGSLDEIKKLINKGSISRFDGEYILPVSIKRPDVLKYLLELGLNPDEKNIFGKTPLMYAAQYNQLDSAKYLLKSGADINTSTHEVESYQRCSYTISTHDVTALHYAVRYADMDFINIILDSGAQVYKEDSDELTPLDWLGQTFSQNSLLDEKDKEELRQKLAVTQSMMNEALNNNLKGEEHYGRKDFDGAFEYFKKAVEVDKENIRALNNMAITSIKLGKQGEAAKYSQRVIKSGVDEKQKSAAYFNYGRACKLERSSTGRDPAFLKYDGDYYCEEPVLYYQLKAYESEPTQTRADALIESMNNDEDIKWKHACSEGAPSGLDVAYKVHWDVYLLADKGYTPSKVIYEKPNQNNAYQYSEFVIDRRVDLPNNKQIIVLSSSGNFVKKEFMLDGLRCITGKNQFYSNDLPKPVLISGSNNAPETTIYIDTDREVLPILYGDTNWIIDSGGKSNLDVYLLKGSISPKSSSGVNAIGSKDNRPLSAMLVNNVIGEVYRPVYFSINLNKSPKLALNDELLNSEQFIFYYHSKGDKLDLYIDHGNENSNLVIYSDVPLELSIRETGAVKIRNIYIASNNIKVVTTPAESIVQNTKYRPQQEFNSKSLPEGFKEFFGSDPFMVSFDKGVEGVTSPFRNTIHGVTRNYD